MAKTKKLQKTHICGIWGLRVNRQVKHPQALSKESHFVIFGFFFFFSLFNAKRLTVKAFLEVTLVSQTPRARHVFSNF